MAGTNPRKNDMPINRAVGIAIGAIVGLALHGLLYGLGAPYGAAANWPLYAVLTIGGGALLVELIVGLAHGKWQADLLAGISIVTAVLLGQYLAGTLVVLMLAGGRALEASL
jgi:cation transport ATPase